MCNHGDSFPFKQRSVIFDLEDWVGLVLVIDVNITAKTFFLISARTSRLSNFVQRALGLYFCFGSSFAESNAQNETLDGVELKTSYPEPKKWISAAPKAE